MRLSKRDLMATALVGAAGLLYLSWAADTALPGMDGPRATGVVILGLGFVASAIAVVPSFVELLHGSRLYLAVTSLIGAVAAAAGIWMVADGSTAALAVLIAAMVVLWAIATAHHRRLPLARDGLHT